MKALFIPFSFIRTVLDGRDTDLNETAFFIHAINLRDLLNTALESGYTAVIYRVDSSPEYDWSTFTQDRVREYYHLPKEGIRCTTFSFPEECMAYCRFAGLDVTQSIFISNRAELDSNIVRSLPFQRAWSYDWLHPELLDLFQVTQFIDPSLEHEFIDSEPLNAILAALAEIALDTQDYIAFVFQLEIIVWGAQRRNAIMWMIVDRIEELAEPVISPLEVDIGRKELRFPYYERKVSLTPKQLTLYLLILNYPKGLRYNEIPDKRQDMVQTYRAITGSDWDTCRQKVDKIISNDRSVLKSNIKGVLEQELLRRLADYYVISVDPDTDRWYVEVAKEHPGLITVF